KSMTGDALTKMCKKLKNLEKLTIISDETTKVSAPCISSQSLLEFSLTRCQFVKWPSFYCPNLKKLHLESIQNLSELHLNTPSLNDLRFRSCKLENIQIGELLSNLKCIKELELFD